MGEDGWVNGGVREDWVMWTWVCEEAGMAGSGMRSWYWVGISTVAVGIDGKASDELAKGKGERTCSEEWWKGGGW